MIVLKRQSDEAECARAVGPNQRHRAAFSLPEMMIAVIILGLGLLFIAAALPVGLSYTRDTIDLGTADATERHAFEHIEQSIRLSRFWSRDNLFRPRGAEIGALSGLVPKIKVRALIARNVDATPGVQRADILVSDRGELSISKWFEQRGGAVPPPGSQYNLLLGGFPGRPGLSSMARVYPPISPIAPYRVNDFFNDNNNYPQYTSRGLFGVEVDIYPAEERKALERRVVWTAFYRRASYGSGSDPLLYEVIVVVARRPSVHHRFPTQDLTTPLGAPRAINTPLSPTIGPGRLAPEPWLVTFTSLPPFPPLNTSLPGQRILQNQSVDAPRLTFGCTLEVGRLLPVGSIFIPAANDRLSSGSTGFVPHSPNSLPIYEVIERPDLNTVVVENNGLYPWVSTGSTAFNWPVWVIPPSYSSYDASNQPDLEGRSPIISVARRLIRLREIP